MSYYRAARARVAPELPGHPLGMPVRQSWTRREVHA